MAPLEQDYRSAAADSGHPGQFVPVHCWKVVNSVRVPAGAADWQVSTHDWSFARHDVAMQVATFTQAGSFGQLVGPEQHAVAMQFAHVEPGVVKI